MRVGMGRERSSFCLLSFSPHLQFRALATYATENSSCPVLPSLLPVELTLSPHCTALIYCIHNECRYSWQDHSEQDGMTSFFPSCLVTFLFLHSPSRLS